MAKIVLDKNSTNLDPLVFNENFRKIEEEFNEKVLYRENPPQEPNEMENDLDMNGNRIYNLPKPIAEHEPARLIDLTDGIPVRQFLRVEDSLIEPIGDVKDRKNKLLYFDNEGNPNTKFPSDDSATQLRADLEDPDGAAMVGFTQDGEGAVDRTVQSKLRDTVSVKDFGAVGDGVTDDTEAFNKALSSHELVYVPPGTYRYDGTISVPGHKGLMGAGGNSVLLAGTPESLITVKVPDGGGFYGNRYGSFSGLRINGNDVGKVGMYIGLAVQRLFSDVAIERFVDKGLVIDNAQNCQFNSISIERCGICLHLANATGNNSFNRIELTGGSGPISTSLTLLVDIDESLPGYGDRAAIGFLRPYCNAFYKCVFERSEQNISLVNSRNTSFTDVNLAATAAASPYVHIGSDGLNNIFTNTYFANGASHKEAIHNHGFQNTFRSSIFEGWTSGDTVIRVWNLTRILDSNGLPSNAIVNMAGNIGFNIRTGMSLYREGEKPTNAYAGDILYTDTEVSVKGRSKMFRLLEGEQFLLNYSNPAAGASGSVTFQLGGNGIYELYIKANYGDQNIFVAAKYLVYVQDNPVNDMAYVEQVGSGVNFGSFVITGVTVTPGGLLTISYSHLYPTPNVLGMKGRAIKVLELL